jgi:Xaa-Pro aminopeptidase
MLGKKIDVFVSAFGPHLRYFTGYSGSNGLMAVAPDRVLFVTDPRYGEQSKAEVSADRCIVTRDALIRAASKQTLFARCACIAFEKESCSYQFVSDLIATFPASDVVPEEGIGAQCMVSKDETELALLRTAASITDRVFTDLLGLLRPGVTELEIAGEIAARHRRYGAENDAFDSIVASGQHSALPHASPTTKAIGAGEFVTLDFGCVYQGYHSDMTRTVAVGRVSREMKKVYAVVLDAQRAGVDAARAGITGKKLDQAARGVIQRAGYGKYFIHGLGHGIGLQIHEEPRVSKKNSEPLVSGSVITIEPGIYIPGKFGVRIEDDVVLHGSGCEAITRSPKELIIL